MTDADVPTFFASSRWLSPALVLSFVDLSCNVGVEQFLFVGLNQRGVATHVAIVEVLNGAGLKLSF